MHSMRNQSGHGDEEDPRSSPPPEASITIHQQAAVLDQALLIFEHKQAVRGDHWVENPASTHIEMIIMKAGRINYIDKKENKSDDDIEEVVDNALDVINFAAFVVRKYTGVLP